MLPSSLSARRLTLHLNLDLVLRATSESTTPKDSPKSPKAAPLIRASERKLSRASSGGYLSRSPRRDSSIAKMIIPGSMDALTMYDERNQTSTDISFICGSSKDIVHAHKAVMISRSVYFRNLMTSEKNTRQIIVLSDVTSAQLSEVVKYMYTNNINVNGKSLVSLYSLAERFVIQDLITLCELSIDKKNVLLVIQMSTSNSLCDNLMECALGFLRRCSETELLAILKEKSLKSLGTAQIVKILQQNLNINEYTLFNIIYNWANSKCKRSHLPLKRTAGHARRLHDLMSSLMKYFNFTEMSETELSHIKDLALIDTARYHTLIVYKQCRVLSFSDKDICRYNLRKEDSTIVVPIKLNMSELLQGGCSSESFVKAGYKWKLVMKQKRDIIGIYLALQPQPASIERSGYQEAIGCSIRLISSQRENDIIKCLPPSDFSKCDWGISAFLSAQQLDTSYCFNEHIFFELNLKPQLTQKRTCFP